MLSALNGFGQFAKVVTLCSPLKNEKYSMFSLPSVVTQKLEYGRL